MEPECKVCYEKYNTENNCPLNLPCGHSFCSTCIQAFQNKNPNFLCPICQKPCMQAEIPKNYAILELLDCLSKSTIVGTAQTQKQNLNLAQSQNKKTSPMIQQVSLIPISKKQALPKIQFNAQYNNLCNECKRPQPFTSQNESYQCAKCPEMVLCPQCKRKGIHDFHCFRYFSNNSIFGKMLYFACLNGKTVYGNTNYACSGCGMQPIIGRVFKCKQCNYYLCEVCRSSGLHMFHAFDELAVELQRCQICNMQAYPYIYCGQCNIKMCNNCKNSSMHLFHQLTQI